MFIIVKIKRILNADEDIETGKSYLLLGEM